MYVYSTPVEHQEGGVKTVVRGRGEEEDVPDGMDGLRALLVMPCWSVQVITSSIVVRCLWTRVEILVGGEKGDSHKGYRRALRTSIQFLQ